MNLELCVSLALQSDLDIIEALPDVIELPMERMDSVIARFLSETERSLIKAIRGTGRRHLMDRSPTLLAASLLESQIRLPLPQVVRLCKRMVELWDQEVEIVGSTETGRLVYHVKMQVESPVRV